MSIHSNGKKQVVWQDFRPIKPKLKTVEVVPEIINKKNRKKIIFPKISKKTVIIIVTLLIMVGIIFVIFYILFFNKINNTSIDADTNNISQSTINNIELGKGSPAFSTITPTGKNISELGGWTLISPDGADPVYTFTDIVDGIGINVSEQELPEDFRDDTEQKIQNLAISFNASEKISIGALTIYIGTSTNGPQSIIFSKNNLLILIKSDTTINNDHWIEYINSLQ